MNSVPRTPSRCPVSITVICWVPWTVYLLPGSFPFPVSKLTPICRVKWPRCRPSGQNHPTHPWKVEMLLWLTVLVVATFAAPSFFPSYFTNEDSSMWHIPMELPGVLAMGFHICKNSRSLALDRSLDPPQAPRIEQNSLGSRFQVRLHHCKEEKAMGI